MKINQQPVELLTNNLKSSFYHYLKDALNRCQSFSFSVAFISDSGLQLIIDDLIDAGNRGVRGKLLTTNYEFGTTPRALEMIGDQKYIDAKLYDALTSIRKFHTKAYIFDMGNHFEIVVGSSNMTQYALKNNHEWNLKYVAKNDDKTKDNIIDNFNELFNDPKSLQLTPKIIKEYKTLYESKRMVDEGKKAMLDFFFEFIKRNPDHEIVDAVQGFNIDENNELKDFIEQIEVNEIKPNEMQEMALEGLNNIRNSGGNKALIIAATGTGKTYLSAFDVLQLRPKKVLFVVHRGKILRDALRTFKTIMPEVSMGEFVGSKKDLESDYLFASVQTISKIDNLNLFDPSYFDYIIIDEAHRSAADSYQRITSYFTPKFLLGMTATPERTDSRNIYELYDNQIAVEIRLRQALEKELVVPFHYFGIEDATTDIQNINLNTEIDKLAEKLNIKARVELIIENIKKYKHSGNKTKALGYCVNIDHAEYMANAFNERGLVSIALTGESDEQYREKVVRQLEDPNDPLSYIFTVEIFNEGIDIPSVNLILMLRPTNSSIIFTQQLGRGLRKYKDKEYLTVLDFIANHKKNFLLPIALVGDKAYDKDDLIVSTANDFFDIPGDTFISLNKVSKERILAQLEATDFNEITYLKEAYQDKKKNLGRVPRLTDFAFDEFDPIRFIKKKKSYISFVASQEKGILKESSEHNAFFKLIGYLDSMLPIKRPYEYAILRELTHYKALEMNELFSKMKKYIDNPNLDSFNHSVKNLLLEFGSVTDKKNNIKVIEKSNSQIRLSDDFSNVFDNNTYTDIINNTISYGLARYHHEFDRKVAPYPFVDLYHEYSKTEIYTLSLFDKNVSGLLMSGLIRIEKEYFLTVNLVKGDVHDSINYDDYFIDQSTFHWQSPGSTRTTNETGKNLVNHKELGFNLHLFVRKSATEATKGKGYSRDFTYLGKVFVEEYVGEAPISFKLKFEHRVPNDIYQRLTYDYTKEKENEKTN